MSELTHGLGQFHPLVIHFPIALLLVAAGVEGMIAIYGNEALKPVVRINLWIGMIFAVGAALSGWYRAEGMGFEPDLKPTLFWHRWLGITMAIWACVVVWLETKPRFVWFEMI